MSASTTFLKKLTKPFLRRKLWIRQIAVTALASATAWLVGDALIHKGGLVAAIVCSLSIRISLYKSVREGLGQIIGTAIGASIALGTVALFNFGFIAVGLTVFLCAVIARALKLGEVASVNVPVTALIVIGPGISETTAVTRLNSTLVGAAIAIVFSYFTHPATPAGRTAEQISNLGYKTSKLLRDMSEGIITNFTKNETGKWLGKGRILVESIPTLRAQSVEAKNYSKWNPLLDNSEAEMLYTRSIAVEHIVVQVRAIARTLFDMTVEDHVDSQLRKDLSIALSATSFAIESKMDHVSDKYHFMDSTIAEELRIESYRLSDLFLEKESVIERAQFVRAMSIVSNIKIIADSLDESSPALADVKTPEEPAHQKVMEVNPLEQTVQATSKIKRFFSKLFR
mgnify:CR=1 FL=1